MKNFLCLLSLFDCLHGSTVNPIDSTSDKMDLYNYEDVSLYDEKDVSLYDDNFCKKFQNDKPHRLISEIMKNPLFLRLKKVSQLSLKKGPSDGKNHSETIKRSDHSKGVRMMASIYINILNENSAPEERISEIESLAVQTAALLHDVGHGPFSHLFEQAPSAVGMKWDHEDQSVRIVKRILQSIDFSNGKSNGNIKKNGNIKENTNECSNDSLNECSNGKSNGNVKENTIDLILNDTTNGAILNNLPVDFIDAVCDMIKGISRKDHSLKYANSLFKKYSIFTIVNGDFETCLDVDKYDYMRRDSFSHCSREYYELVSKTVESIVLNSKIENDRIVYSAEAAESLVLFSHLIYNNYRYLYYDSRDTGLELLFLDILKGIDMNFGEYLEDLDKFVSFDDEEFIKLLSRAVSQTKSSQSVLFERFNRREGYLMIGSIDFEDTNIENTIVNGIEEEFFNQLVDIKNEDCVFVTKTINRVVKKKTGKWNILETVPFYSTTESIKNSMTNSINQNPITNSINWSNTIGTNGIDWNNAVETNSIIYNNNLVKNSIIYNNNTVTNSIIGACVNDEKMKHQKYLKKYNQIIKSSFPAISEDVPFQGRTVQLRLYSKTADEEKIKKMTEIFNRINRQKKLNSQKYCSVNGLN